MFCISLPYQHDACLQIPIQDVEIGSSRRGDSGVARSGRTASGDALTWQNITKSFIKKVFFKNLK